MLSEPGSDQEENEQNKKRKKNKVSQDWETSVPKVAKQRIKLEQHKKQKEEKPTTKFDLNLGLANKDDESSLNEQPESSPEPVTEGK